jgi:hypothetical protein
MGVSHSKEHNIYLITYNCQIKYYSTFKSNRLLNYILNFKNNKFVFCIQGLYDKKTIEYLENNINEDLTKITSKYDNGLYIISNFDITSIQHYLFNHDHTMKDLIDIKKGFISFNVAINENLISIYNTELQSDISNNLLFNEIRLKQISEILLFITNRKINETHLKLHIIMGTLYLDEIKSNKLYDVLNIFENNYISNIDDNKKDDYILFFSEIKYTSEEIINYMKEKFGIQLINVIIRNDMNFSKHLPCELIFKLIT